jgi:hypothetical protein
MGKTLERIGIPSVALLVAIGTYWAYTRGGIDFAVFYHAWRLVLEGRGAEIYVNSPDRYLYAPGFAWLLSPLGLLPHPVALAFWCLLKALALGLLIRKFGTRVGMGICACSVWVMSRPLLIDLQYGQINFLILAVCVWALAEHFSRIESKPWKTALSWFLLGVLAVSKIFPSPLMILPWLRTKGVSQSRLRLERYGVILGVLLTLFVPIVTMGFHGMLELFFSWRTALLDKGLPYASHNQSFVAALHHYFTTDPTHVISLGSQWVVIGKDLLSLETISMLSMGWTFITAGFLFAWLLKGKTDDSLRWIAVAVSFLFVPLYLIWKPYFVFGLPLAMVIAQERSYSRGFCASVLGIAFVLTNLTGFDMIGGYWSGRLEAASLFLWVHLALVALVIFPATRKTYE